MGKKYIIELEDNQMAYVTTIIDGMPYIKLPQTLPYTEPGVERVKREAYREGREAGIKDGMCDAWEAARKIVLDKEDGGLDTVAYCEIFGYGKGFRTVMKTFSASEVIEKLKAYEQEQDAEIKVGDEVAFRHDYGPDIVVVVTYIGQDGFIDCMDGRGSQYAHKNPKRCTKTGRHFPEIAAVLEKMREGQE